MAGSGDMPGASSERSGSWRWRAARGDGGPASELGQALRANDPRDDDGPRVCSPRAVVVATWIETIRPRRQGKDLRRFLAGRTPEDVPVQERGDTLVASRREARHADLERVALLHRDLLAKGSERVVKAVALDDAGLTDVGIRA